MLITEKVLTLFNKRLQGKKERDGKRRSEGRREGAQEADLCEKPFNRSINHQSVEKIEVECGGTHLQFQHLELEY